MLLKNWLASLAIVGSVATLGSGCVVRARGGVYANTEPTYVEVEEEPPPPRVVVVDTRPGFIWVQGRWNRSGNRWVWFDGHWERERAGQVWEQGRWERRGRGHVWIGGRWRSHGGGNGPAVRDHRDNGRHNGNGGGPVIRDHRH